MNRGRYETKPVTAQKSLKGVCSRGKSFSTSSRPLANFNLKLLGTIRSNERMASPMLLCQPVHRDPRKTKPTGDEAIRGSKRKISNDRLPLPAVKKNTIALARRHLQAA